MTIIKIFNFHFEYILAMLNDLRQKQKKKKTDELNNFSYNFQLLKKKTKI